MGPFTRHRDSPFPTVPIELTIPKQILTSLGSRAHPGQTLAVPGTRPLPIHAGKLIQQYSCLPGASPDHLEPMAFARQARLIFSPSGASRFLFWQDLLSASAQKTPSTLPVLPTAHPRAGQLPAAAAPRRCCGDGDSGVSRWKVQKLRERLQHSWECYF